MAYLRHTSDQNGPTSHPFALFSRSLTLVHAHLAPALTLVRAHLARALSLPRSLETRGQVWGEDFVLPASAEHLVDRTPAIALTYCHVMMLHRRDLRHLLMIYTDEREAIHRAACWIRMTKVNRVSFSPFRAPPRPWCAP